MTAASDELTRQHRRQQLVLRAVTVRELIGLWPALDFEALHRSWPGWALAVGRLVQDRRAMSAGLSAQYLRNLRAAAGVRGDQPATLAGPLAAEKLLISLRVTAVAMTLGSIGNGMSRDTARTHGLVRVSGAVSRHVLDAGRETVLATVKADPRARGWQRVTGGNACAFCRMLAGRGAVYREDTAGFESHDHCGCSAEPQYR